MKTKHNLALILLILLGFTSFSQNVEPVYRRSSLYTMIIDEPNRPFAKEIKEAFFTAPFPDKFNNHTLDKRLIPNAIPKGIMGKNLRQAIQSKNIWDELEQQQLAKAMVAKWFNRDENGCFDMKLISERGKYDATEMDLAVAQSSKRGVALLADAGEELIKSTFLVVNDLDYVNKEDIATGINLAIDLMDAVQELSGEEGMDDDTKALVQTGVAVVGKGYVVRTTSYLYRLVWNDSIAAVFYNDYWMTKDNFDQAKKEAFDKSDIFKLKFVGSMVAWADLQSTIFTQKKDEELISIATVRAMNSVIAKLQKRYEVFRTKTPLHNVDPLSAKIGLKEGLKKNDRYEVLEQISDKQGLTKYKRKGYIKVDKTKIWDNRYMVEEADNYVEDENFTLFKGSSKSKYYAGMLIRQSPPMTSTRPENKENYIIPKDTTAIAYQLVKHRGSLTMLDTNYNKETVFLDDFDNNDNGWQTYLLPISNGEYRIESIMQDPPRTSLMKLDVNSKRDLELSTTYTLMWNRKSDLAGLAFETSSDEMYFFGINKTRQYQIVKVTGSSNRETIVDWTPCPFIQRMTKPNKLTVRKLNNEYWYYINDIFIRKTPFAGFTGTVGLFIGQASQINVDKLSVSYLIKSR
jgi:hypothetical protein